MYEYILGEVWSACDKFLDHDAEDAANDVSTEDRLRCAIDLIEYIGRITYKG